MEALNATILLVDVDAVLDRTLQSALAEYGPLFISSTVFEASSHISHISNGVLVLSSVNCDVFDGHLSFVDRQLRAFSGSDEALTRALSFCTLGLRFFNQSLKINQLESEVKRWVEYDQSVQMREELLATFSHDLRTPLNGLLLDTQLRRLQLDKGNSEAFSRSKLVKLFERDERQLLAMARLLERLL